MKSIILSILKYVSLPIAVLYGLVVSLRNKMYDWGVFDAISFSIPVISVGNITVGGTGKSPHIEYIIELISHKYQTATLSRGYKRATRGFRLASANSNAKEIGDEPFQFKSKYPQLEVCVAEERMTAIPQLLQKKPFVEVILLDDAFQHRTVKPGLSILLSDFDRLYTNDFIMPFGLLRESRKAAKRAEIIIITKCSPNLSDTARIKIENEIKPLSYQTLYFSAIQYKQLYALYPNEAQLNIDTEILLVTGIANPLPLLQHLKKIYKKVHPLSFKDHHYFTFDDLSEIKEAFDHLSAQNKIIVTTEKDASRLMLLQEKIIALKLPFYAQSIGIEILFDAKEKLDTEILEFIEHIIPPKIIMNNGELLQEDEFLQTDNNI
jgi:tetraacyldisaccharide 4'-kinase